MRRIIPALALGLATSALALTAPSTALAAGTTNGGLLATFTATLDGLDGSHIQLPADMAPSHLADFSADGASLADYAPFTRNIFVRRADGTSYVLGTVPSGQHVDFVSWAGGASQYVVVVMDDNATYKRSVWRYRQGLAPVKLLGGLSQNTLSFAADARSTRLVFQAPDSDLVSLNTDTGATTILTQYCTSDSTTSYYCDGGAAIDEVLDLNPVNGSILVAWHKYTVDVSWSGYGWFTPGTAFPTQWYAPANNPQGLLVSPDGSEVALQMLSGGVPKYSEVRSAASSALLTTVTGAVHVAWQPCPSGVCAVFVGPAKPSAPRNVTAYAGASDPEVTARVTWAAPTKANPAVTGYQVNVVRLSSTGAVVTSKVYTGPATARNATFWLLKTRYKFRVRAENDLGWGPWSAYSNAVTAR